MGSQYLTPDLFFPEAFELWLNRRTMTAPAGINLVMRPTNVKFLSKRSIKDYRACAVALGKFFKHLRLGDIHPGHMTEYQRARAYCDNTGCVDGGWKKPCGSNRILKEIDLLVRILKGARLWGEEQKTDFTRVSREELEVDRAMDPEQQDHFLKTAASRDDWHFVLWYACVGLQTAAATNELRSLRLGDIVLGQPGFEMIHIRPEGAKNKYRIRTIPLEGQAIWAMGKLIERANSLGSVSFHHYLFPLRQARGEWDPTKPMSDSGLKKRWNAVREKAGLDWLRPYDLRHTGITRMAEAGVPIDVAMSLVGHMTMAMHRRYTSISQGSKRKWLKTTWSSSKESDPTEGMDPRKGNAKPPRRVNQSSNGFAQKRSQTA